MMSFLSRQICTINRLLLLCLLVISSGCAEYGHVVEAKYKDTKAKKFITKEDKAVIYIYRTDANVAAEMPVSLNGSLIAVTHSKTFLKVAVDPGMHEISSNEGNFSAVTIKTEAGNSYYVLQELMGGVIVTGSNLQEVSEEEGQSGVQAGRLIKSEYSF